MASEQVEQVRKLVEGGKLNMKAVSIAAGLGETFVRDMLKRDREPSADNLRKVLDAIARLTGRVPLDVQAASEVSASDHEGIHRTLLPRDVDVLGGAAGSDFDRGSFHFSMDPIDNVARPPGLVGINGVYAVYVENDSMYPMYKSGDLVFVNRLRPPAPGDTVVIQYPGEVESDFSGFIKVLVRRSSDWIECRQFNPEGPVKYRNVKGLTLHRVYTNNELFGI